MSKEDGRKNNGCKKGENRGQGRKPKADEIKKIEMMDSVCTPKELWVALHERIKKGDTKAIQFWIEHRYGKAPDKVDVTTNGKNVNRPFIMFGNKDSE